MKTTELSFKTRLLGHALFQNILVKLLFILTLSIIQFPVQALQFESVAMRNMNTYKKFNGVSQNAIVIKSKIDRSKYFDRIEFASGELGNDVDNSFFVSAGPSWRFNKRIVGSGLAFLELGTSPTWIEDGNFGDESLGGHIFFTSNVQLGMHFGYRRELTLSVRLHHISNGGLSSKNPGTDMVGVELSYALGR
jgi:hypothetical protein